ncbi:MAG: cytochrome P450, partial [Granulosicoccus sp.]|nr:cytochrome P450 [Granulosicoccus sp.]
HKKDDGLIAQLLHDDSHATALSDDELISNTILLLNAGHEATVHQLGNAVYTLLLTYPLSRRNELISLLANDRTANAVVTECLRFCAPLHLFTRFAQSDITLEANVKVHRGEQIGLLLAAANRCPAKFRNPNTFDPMREDTAHLSLGAGLHFCLGAQLARLELLVALQVLFDRLPGLELASKPQYQDAWHFHGLVELPLRW